MGNGFAKQVACCFSAGYDIGGGALRRRIDSAAVISEPFDEGLGHSFCYVSNPNPNPAQSKFYSISGASVSANASTALSTALPCGDADLSCPLSAAAFDSSTSFASYPLCPIPAADRGFLSGPIDRSGFLSGPLDPRASGIFSGPLDRKSSAPTSADRLRRSFSHGGRLIRNISKRIGRSISVPIKISKESSGGEIGDDSDNGGNFQWAQGKAGEDRVHIVVSEEHGWIFVGIYDGFNGPDATDFLLSNLYSAVQGGLKGILWVEEQPAVAEAAGEKVEDVIKKRTIRWKCDWDEENSEASERLRRSRSMNSASHAEVLKAMNQALRRTEEDFFDIADKMAEENPELALMGSCVLAVLMKGEDVYLMNVGDSRAVLGQTVEMKSRQDLERISEESLHDGEAFGGDGGRLDLSSTLAAIQLNMEHSTCDKEEVRRIRSEHRDDACAVMNNRVKGSLKVTRAFGAGFLKQPKWNDALLEMFRIDYVGTSPYITCSPFLSHRRLGPKDRFLILSSDGLYEYFTNEEAVAQVEMFIATTPEGDPAQHLVEEVIFRAAKKAGLDFHKLLEIPQGDRRRYHDDVSVIIISFEGRIWRSCV